MHDHPGPENKEPIPYFRELSPEPQVNPVLPEANEAVSPPAIAPEWMPPMPPTPPMPPMSEGFLASDTYTARSVPSTRNAFEAKPDKTADERSKSGRVLLCCCIAVVVSLVLGIAAISVLGVHVDRAENGVLRVWVGPAPAVVITQPPVPTPLSAVSDAPPLTAPPAGTGMRAEDIYAKAAPGVVGILSVMDRSGATGTGMVLREDGYILTNHHVVDEARTVTVVLPDGSELEATLVGSDYLSDIAVLKVNRTGLSCVELGSSEGMVTGAKCYAIGNPLGMELQNTFTDGMISAINRDIVLSDISRGDIIMTVLQTNCAVNPGNSGGPLLNDRGQVIGIVSSKIMGDFSSTVEGLGFAIPVDTAIPIINSLIEHGFVKGRPVIGITPSATQLDERTAADLNLPLGVVIGDVDRNSDAYRKGIRVRDIITHVNGEEVSTVADINRIKNRFMAGDTLTLTVYSNGVVSDIDIVLGEAAG